ENAKDREDYRGPASRRGRDTREEEVQADRPANVVKSPLHSLTPKVLNVEHKTERWRVPRTHLCLEWNMFAEESCCVESAGIGRASQRIESDPARGPTASSLVRS